MCIFSSVRSATIRIDYGINGLVYSDFLAMNETLLPSGLTTTFLYPTMVKHHVAAAYNLVAILFNSDYPWHGNTGALQHRFVGYQLLESEFRTG